MKNLKLKSTILLLSVALPSFVAQANNDTENKDELRTELLQIQQRLASLEGQGEKESTLSNTSFNFYGSLRPTFGVTRTDSEDVWDVGDATSRIGFAAEHQLGNGMTGFAKGEFKVDIQDDGDFGDARKAYVGIKGTLGQVAIGKQAVTQEMISDPVDIFNRSGTPLAYDSASPFRINNLVTYRKNFGDILFSADAQFDGSKGDGGSDFFNAGIRYDSDLIYAAVAYYTRELSDGKDEKTIGTTLAKSFGPLYFAAAYQGIEIDSVDGSTLDMVATYAINDIYKVKLGVSEFDDGGSDASSGNYSAYNTTLEWHRTADFSMFVEYQKTDFEYRETNDQLMIGMRYNFDYSF